MKLFGLTVEREKSSLVPIPARSSSGWFTVIRESFAGAWQRNIEVENKENLLAFSAVYACVSLIADDISKLRIKLLTQADNGIWEENKTNTSHLPVLKKPNRFQTRIQFLSNWMTCKLLYGNSYILKQRDQRGIVNAMYVLDPRLVVPLVTENGDVYYQLNRDPLAEVPMPIEGVPASEVIHDRTIALWHPLVGVSPISACGNSATQGLKIQGNSAKFFENMSRPSGQLTAPGPISDENAKRLKEEFENNFMGSNIGRLLVTGDGLKYEPMTIPANDAQLIEQLRWTVEDVARCFKIPLYKLGIGSPPTSSIAPLNMEYYQQVLQCHIESIECLLDEGLELPPYLGTELDLEGLLRMDPLSRAEHYARAIGAGYMSPNEARLTENMKSVEGGDTPYLQQQNYSLAALNKRDSKEDPFAPPGQPAGGAPAMGGEPEPEIPALPAPPKEDGGILDQAKPTIDSTLPPGEEKEYSVQMKDLEEQIESRAAEELADLLIAKFAIVENVSA